MLTEEQFNFFKINRFNSLDYVHRNLEVGDDEQERVYEEIEEIGVDEFCKKLINLKPEMNINQLYKLVDALNTSPSPEREDALKEFLEKYISYPELKGVDRDVAMYDFDGNPEYKYEDYLKFI